MKDAGQWADVVMLAVPYGAIDAVVGELGDAVNGETLVEVTNARTDGMQFASGCTTSGSEALQQKARTAKVVKAFTQFAQHMESGTVGRQQVTTFVAGDDATAKAQVMQMARDIGFDTVDAGPLQNARLLEPLG